MEPSYYKENGYLEKEIEDELMKFTKSEKDLEVDAKLLEQSGEMQRCTEAEISITECTKSLGTKLFEGECQDTTESSSSFDGSDCGTKNVDTSDDSDSSDFSDEAASAPDYGKFGEKFMMRKKLTTHWRSFIQPLMWRCKWIELQIKKLQSKAQQYDRELERLNKQKQTQLGDFALDDGMKSHPFSHFSARCDILRRKKRRISEATTDVAAYMSRHSLFSYYAENKKSFPERPFLSNESKILATHKVITDDEIYGNGDLPSLEAANGDSSFEHLLSKIHYLHSQVDTLKSRIDCVMSENADKFSCTHDFNLAMLCSASTSNSGDGMPVGTFIASQLISEYNMGSVCDSGVTSRGDVCPQASGSTCYANAYGNVEDGVLIDNQRVKEEMNTFEEVKIPKVEMAPVLKDGLDKTTKEEVHTSQEVKIHPIQSPLGSKTPLVPAEPDIPMDENPAPKIRSLAKLTATKSRKKRRRRKGAGRWSRRPKVCKYV